MAKQRKSKKKHHPLVKDCKVGDTIIITSTDIGKDRVNWSKIRDGVIAKAKDLGCFKGLMLENIDDGTENKVKVMFNEA